MTTRRTDPHTPANFNPEDYSYVGFIYCGPLEDAWDDPTDDETREFITAPGTTHVGPYGIGQCDHCGSRYIYGSIWEYLPGAANGKRGWIAVGNDCARGRFQCPDRLTFELATLRKKVAVLREYGKKSAAVRAIMDEHPELADASEWMREVDDTIRALAEAKGAIADRGDEDTPEYADAAREHAVLGRLVGYNVNTISDIVSKLFRYGSVSPKQIAFVARLHREGETKLADAKRIAEEIKAMTPLDAGRREIEGVIKSAKAVENGFGYSIKLAIALDSGHTVYGTCPEALAEQVDALRGFGCDLRWYAGLRVRLTATIDPSVGDNDFAVYKRPAKPELLDATPLRERMEAEERERALAWAKWTLDHATRTLEGNPNTTGIDDARTVAALHRRVLEAERIIADSGGD